MKIPAKAVDSSLVGIFAYITVKVRLETIRRCMLEGCGIKELLPFLFLEILLGAAMLAAVCVIIRAAERHVRKVGNLTLF
ncbi:hypothetical protein [Eisenbergiella sp.]